MTDRARSGVVTRGARVVMEARARMEAMKAKPAPTRDELKLSLDDVRREQSKLFQEQRARGLTARQHERSIELGRLELKLMADIREAGRRLIGARHHRR